jgi:hypothetical protein
VESQERWGDFHLRQRNTESAAESYQCAGQSLSELMQQSYILALVHLVRNSRAELTPREKKIVSRVTQKSKAKNAAKNNKVSAPRKKLVIVDDESMELDGNMEVDSTNEEISSGETSNNMTASSGFSDCLPLQCLENRIRSKRGDIALERGQLHEAEDIYRAGLSRYRALVSTFSSRESNAKGNSKNAEKLQRNTKGTEGDEDEENDTQLNSSAVSRRTVKSYEIDQMTLLYNLGKVSLAKGILVDSVFLLRRF